MKKVQFIFYAFFICFIIAKPSGAQEYDMQKAIELATPNENHARLETDFGGTWSYTTTSDFPGFSMEGSGTSSNKMILGGRFLMIEAEGTMLGQIVKSITIMGYDNALEKYTMIGIDELGTYYITAAGTYDEATRKYTLDGTYEEPVIKEMQNYRFVFDVTDPDKPITRIFFENEQGELGEMMTLNYTR